MSSDLANICHSLLTKGNGTDIFDHCLIDYLSVLSEEKIDITRTVRDPFLPEFVRLSIMPFSRLSISKDEGLISKLRDIISYWLRLFALHPSFLDCFASFFPVESALSNIVQFFGQEFCRVLGEFTAFVSTSNSTLVKTAASARQVLDTILKIMDSSYLARYGIIAFAGMLRSSPVIATTVKTYGGLRQYKAVLTAALSGDDHLSAVGAIASLQILFPRSIDKETAKTAAMHAISVSSDDFLMLQAASWILIDVSRDLGIITEDFQYILRIAFSSTGTKAHVLFETMNYMVANSGVALAGQSLNPGQLATYLLGQTSGFVSVSVIRLIQQLGEQSDHIFDNTEDLESVCVRALEVAVSPSLSIDVDLVECAVLILRLIVSSPICFEKLRRTLEANEENIFVAFQRNIESNRAFSSLGLFLFLSIISQHCRGWGNR
jgi:hypothetical protein